MTNEFNCGAIRLPISTEDLFIFLEDRHLNFFESMIQANMRKEAENIPLIAFQFWSNEKIAEQLESETLKFLYSDLKLSDLRMPNGNYSFNVSYH